MNHIEIAHEIHAANVAAGWWTDLDTGESILVTRNRGEMLMLVVTELSEADTGVGMQDDKLPHLPMFDVELADAAIRLYDQIGAEMALGRPAPHFSDALDGCMKAIMDVRDTSAALMHIVNSVSDAMEHWRKQRIGAYMNTLGRAVRDIYLLAELCGIDLPDIIAQKRAFNATREDHKPENRRAEGGKKV